MYHLSLISYQYLPLLSLFTNICYQLSIIIDLKFENLKVFNFKFLNCFISLLVTTRTIVTYWLLYY